MCVLEGVRKASQRPVEEKKNYNCNESAVLPTERQCLEIQWQPQPPPQQEPPEGICADDVAEAPFPFPFGALNTES
jgi:hypothetical protein